MADLDNDDDFGKLLDDWLDNVEAVTSEISLEEQAEITKAGADVYADKLAKFTREKHYGSGHKYPGYAGGELHMANDVRAQSLNLGGELDGTSTVGFGWTAYIARFHNNGTKFMKGDHFVENTRQESIDDILTAEAIAYKKQIDEAQS